MSAAAITCAISPPMTPAPTTAALKTNIGRTLAAGLQLHLHISAPLAGEAGERAAQRGDDLTAHEQAVDQPGQRVALLERVVELERDLDGVGSGSELDPLRAAQAAVLDLQRLAAARLICRHDLTHSAAAPWRAVPRQPTFGGPAVGQ